MSEETEVKNAIIKFTSLGTEDHGIFTSYLHVVGDSWGVGVGGYGLDNYNPEKKRRIDKTGLGLEYIKKILWVVGVEKWEQLPGKHVRVVIKSAGYGAEAVGHILEDKWFWFKEWFDEQLSD